jgi:osmotically inducible protein OsmC
MRTVTFARSAQLLWDGDVVRGSGKALAGSGAFTVGATFPTLRGEPPGTTTPEELLAASHAVCYGIGLRSILGRRGGSATRIAVTATITADKGDGAIRIRRSHLSAVVEGLAGIATEALPEIGEAAKRECTISNAIGGSVEVTHEVASM